MDRPSGAESGGGGPGVGPVGVGVTLGNYRISSLLGQGGMGSVYLAEHQLIGRKVAIKVLDPQIADNPDVISRFFVEARAVNEIRHPNIVDVTDLGMHAGRPFIVMEYLAGENLEDRLARAGRLTEEETVRIARQVTSALGAAHERGMVHRDLKPANIMLRDHPDYPDFVKVLDFGIAKLLGAAQTPSSHHTEVGTLLGTPAYMSPEQCLGDLQLDHRSDIYSLGVILFQMLSGRLPFEGDAVGRLILAHVNQPAPPLSLVTPYVSPGIAAVVARTLEKKPESRFASMKDLRTALEQAIGAAVFPRSLTPVGGVPIAPGPAGPASPPPAPPAVHPSGTMAFGSRPAGPARLPPSPIPQTPQAVRQTPPPLTAVAFSSQAPLADRVREALVERLSRGQLELPPLPASYTRSLQLLRDPAFSFAALAAAFKQDTRLCSHVVRRSNSDGVPGRGVAVTPEQAIARLGLHGLRVAIVELGARRVMESRDERLEEELRKPWHHALAGAIVAERLTRQRGMEEESSDAYLAALLRDLGVPLVAALVFSLEFELGGHRGVRSLRPEVWLPMVHAHQRAAGVMLVRHWALSDELARAVAEADRLQPASTPTGSAWTLGNLACLSGALADREGFYLRRDYLSHAESLAIAGTQMLGVSELTVRRTLDRLKEAIRMRE